MAGQSERGKAGAATKARVWAALLPALRIIINPGHVVRDLLQDVPVPFCLAVSGAAFTLLFLQTGLDLWRVGERSPAGVAVFAFIGALYGVASVAAASALAWAIMRPLGGNRSLDWALRAFSLAYAPSLLYAFLGLFFNLAFAWHTALAFGATGMLWAFSPIFFAVREMSGERLVPSLAITTLCGGALLFGWAFIAI